MKFKDSKSLDKAASILMLLIFMLFAGIAAVAQTFELSGTVLTKQAYDLHIYECDTTWDIQDTIWVPYQRGLIGHKGSYDISGFDTEHKYMLRFSNSKFLKYVFISCTDMTYNIKFDLDIEPDCNGTMLVFYNKNTDKLEITKTCSHKPK